MRLGARGVGLALAAIVGLSGCGDEQRAGPAAGEEGPALAPYVDGQFVDLPSSPLGQWDEYNWVWLADRSGFVQAGAAGRGGRPDESTRRASFFSFADRRFTTLPDLPVSEGLGAAGGGWVGDTLVLFGQDCPAVTDASNGGIEYCADGGAGAKVALTYRVGDAGWQRHDLPDWITDFVLGSPLVVGVRGDEIVVAAGQQPTHIGAFTPATGDWVLLADEPAVDPQQVTVTPIPGVTTTLGVPPNPSRTARLPTTFCMVGEQVVASSVTPAYGVTDGYFEPGFWRLDGEEWTLLRSPVEGPLESAICTPAGFLVSSPLPSDHPVTVMDQGAAMKDQLLWFSNPLADSGTNLGRVSGSLSSDPRQRFGDLVILRDGEVVGPTGRLSIRLDPYSDVIVGRYVIRGGDEPRLARLGVGG